MKDDFAIDDYLANTKNALSDHEGDDCNNLYCKGGVHCSTEGSQIDHDFKYVGFFSDAGDEFHLPMD